MSVANLAAINIYPIKSLRGHQVGHSLVERMGLQDDRRLMVVDPDGMFVTQREYARMALITPVLTGGQLSLTAPGMQELSIEISTTGEHIAAEIWDSFGVDSIDQGNEAAAWLSEYLHMPARLIRMAEGFTRTVDPKYALHADDQVSFADGYPILIVSQESLDDLNSRLARPIPMNRFRPNLVVNGVSAFAEDGWKRIRVGQVELALVKPCARCNIPTINQETGESTKEPNTTLAKFRKRDGKVFFGMNVIPLTTGRVQAGDPVEILE